MGITVIPNSLASSDPGGMPEALSVITLTTAFPQLLLLDKAIPIPIVATAKGFSSFC
jgi:hypothetical protein